MFSTTAIILTALASIIGSAITASISKKSASSVAETTAESNEEINAASLEQSQQQFETSNYLNSTGYQVAANRSAGINSDFENVTSQGAASGVDYSAFAGNAMSSNSEAAAMRLQGVQQAAQTIASGVQQSIQCATMAAQMKQINASGGSADLSYREQLQQFADNYVIENTDVSAFDNPDVFGNWIEDKDENGNVIGGYWENMDELSLQKFYNSDSYLKYMANGENPRYGVDEFKNLGFSDKDADLISKIAQSSLGRSNVRAAIYEKQKQLFEKRFGYDVAKSSPFNRTEYQDVVQVASDYSKSIVDTTMARLSADFEKSKDEKLFYGSKNNLRIGDLQAQVTASEFQKVIKYFETNSPEDFGAALSMNDINALELQNTLNKVNQLCLNAQLEVAQSAMASNNAWARQYGFYQLSCLQQGKFAPLDTASQAAGVVGDVVGSFTSLGNFFNTAQSLGYNFKSSSIPTFSQSYY